MHHYVKHDESSVVETFDGEAMQSYFQDTSGNTICIILNLNQRCLKLKPHIFKFTDLSNFEIPTRHMHRSGNKAI